MSSRAMQSGKGQWDGKGAVDEVAIHAFHGKEEIGAESDWDSVPDTPLSLKHVTIVEDDANDTGSSSSPSPAKIANPDVFQTPPHQVRFRPCRSPSWRTLTPDTGDSKGGVCHVDGSESDSQITLILTPTVRRKRPAKDDVKVVSPKNLKVPKVSKSDGTDNLDRDDAPLSSLKPSPASASNPSSVIRGKISQKMVGEKKQNDQHIMSDQSGIALVAMLKRNAKKQWWCLDALMASVARVSGEKSEPY